MLWWACPYAGRRFLPDVDAGGFLRRLERLMISAAYAASWKETCDAR